MKWRLLFSMEEFRYDLRQIGLNWLWPLVLWGFAAMTSWMSLRRGTAGLYELFTVYQVIVPLIGVWVAIFAQHDVLECHGSELFFSLSAGKGYIGPVRSLRMSAVCALMALTTACWAFTRLAGWEASGYACLLLWLQAQFMASLALLAVSAVKNCMLAMLAVGAYLTLFLFAGELLPQWLNIFFSEEMLYAQNASALLALMFKVLAAGAVAALGYARLT